ncbi:MAG: Ig-like domain-containing protein [Eubacterium sp.]|nr:Ig-like domain-containing protein [Eubacterium sp.]
MQKSRKILLTLIITILAVLGVFQYFRYNALAANDLHITCDGEVLTPSTAREVKNKQVQLILQSDSETMYEDKTLYEVQWSIETGRDIATIEEGSAQIYGIITAKAPGEVTVSATVYNKTGDEIGTTIGSVTCKLRVVFSVDTSINDNVFKYAHQGDSSKSMFMRVGDENVPLALNYGEAADAQWTSSNSEVVEVSPSGVVKPVGAGKAKITATYTPEDSPETSYTTSVDAYVYPSVSNKNSGFMKNAEFGIDNGSSVYVDADFSNNTEAINNKVVWVIKKDTASGGEELIADSFGKQSDLISVTPISSRSNQLRVTGKAGVYRIYFYPRGAYESESDNISNDVFAPTVLNLTIYASFSDYAETIPVDSNFSIADAFNITVDEFNEYFNVTMSSNAGAWQTYADKLNEGAVVHAKDTNVDGTTIVYADVITKPEYRNFIRELTNPEKAAELDSSKFRISLTIGDTFTLDQTYITMYVGQNVSLNSMFNGSGIPNTDVSWSSSDPSLVTVDATGTIKGVKVTSEDVTIRASYTNNSNGNGGREYIATCKVKVITTAANLTISQTSAVMNVGESIVLNVKANPEVAIAPYDWYISDESALSYTLTSDNKTATITAKAVPADGGSVTVTVVNSLNKEQEVCTVKINAPYESIKLNKESVEMKSGATQQLKIDSFTPKNVTMTDISWSSLDTGIVTVDEYGTLTGKGPGATFIMVAPKYNPNGVYVQIPVKVTSGCEELSLSDADLTINAGTNKVVKVSLLPVGCVTTLSWEFTDNSVASVNYDEDTNQATIVGKKAGETILFVKSSEGPAAQLKIHVKQPITKLSFSPTTCEILAGETFKPTIVKTPADGTDTITFSSYNTAVATVDSATGVITGKKTGTTFIQASTSTGQVAVIQVNVKEAATGLKLNPEKADLKVGQSITLSPEFTPKETHDKTVTWTTSDGAVVKLTKPSNGSVSDIVVTGAKGGTALVKGVSKSGGFVVSCLVTVTEKTKVVTTLKLTPKKKTIQKGKKFTIKAKYKTASSKKKLKWKSSKKSVAKVNSKGRVTAKKVGTATITCMAQDGSKVKATCKVKVINKVKKIKLSRYNVKVLVGRTFKLSAKITPKKATIRSLSWSSSDNAVATVDSTGRIQGISPGLCKIRAKSKDGSNKSAVCLVNVVEPVPATGVTVSNQEVIVTKGRHIQSGITIEPFNSSDGIRYYSDNKRVATVNSNGKIYAKRRGQATIYGVTSNGMQGHVDVLVVGMNRTKLPLRLYDKEQLSVDEIKEGITWYSSKPSIASVSASGLVTAKRKGTCRIYAKVRGLKMSCKVTVRGL